MKERTQEMKGEARRGPRADEADGERVVLVKIADMPEMERAMAKRLHAIIKASAPALSTETSDVAPAALVLAVGWLDRLARRRLVERRLRLLPVGLEYLHGLKVHGVAAYRAERGKPRLHETPLRPFVPVERVEIDASQSGMPEGVAEERVDGIGAVAVPPIATVADHDPELCFTPRFVDVVNHAVADVLTGMGVHGKSLPPTARIGQFFFVQAHCLLKRETHGRGSIQLRKLWVGAPPVVAERIGQPLLSEQHLLAFQLDWRYSAVRQPLTLRTTLRSKSASVG